MSPKEQPPPGFQTQAGTENTHKNVCMCARIFAMTAFSFNLVLLKVNTIEMWAVCMYDRKKEECEKGRQNKDAAASNNLNIVFFNPTDDYFTSPTTQIKPTVQWHVYELYHVSNTTSVNVFFSLQIMCCPCDRLVSCPGLSNASWNWHSIFTQYNIQEITGLHTYFQKMKKN